MNKIILAILVMVSFIFDLQAQKNFEEIVKVADTITEVKNKIRYLNNSASDLISQNYKVSKQLALLAIQLADSLHYDSALMYSYNTIGIVNYHTGNYKDAFEYYFKAYQIFENKNDTEGKATIENNIGIVYYYIGDYDQALNHYFKALKLNKEIKKKESSFIYNNIGIILGARNKYKEAYKYYIKSLAIFINMKDSGGISTVYNNIGEVFNNLMQYDSAKIYYSKSLKISMEMKDIGRKALCYLNFGDIANKEKDYPLAKKDLNIAEKIFTEIGDTVSLIDVNFLRAKIALNQKKYDKALKFVQNALNTAKKVGYIESQRDLYELISKIYDKQGRLRLALNRYKKFKAISDSLSKQDIETRIANHELQYEFENQKKEIELRNIEERSRQSAIINRQRQNRNLLLIAGLTLLILMLFFIRANIRKKKYNQELLEKNQQINEHTEELLQTLQQLSLREQQLADLNRTKDRLFSIIGHDLRGPVGSLEKLLEMLTEQFDKFTIHDIHSMLQTAKESSQQTFSLLENLLLWAKSQKKEVIYEPKYQSIKPLVESNYRLLKGTAEIKSIEIIIEGNDECIAFFDENSISTVFRNLLSNAIKYTPIGGNIDINCKEIDESIQIKVKDSGVGLEQKTIKRIFNPNDIFTTFGTNNEKGTGLGLKLCFDLITQNKGNIKIESNVGIGSTFIIILPKTKIDEQQ